MMYYQDEKIGERFLNGSVLAEAITPDLEGWDSHADAYSFPGPSLSSAMDSMSPASLASFSSFLTPTESHAFSLPSHVNGPSTIDDWIDVGLPKDKQALAKATKDLLSLDTNFVAHGDHLFSYLSNPSPSHYPNGVLSHPPHSDSSRTPTPTSISPFPLHPQSSGRQTSRARPSHPRPYPTSPAIKQCRPSRSNGSASPPLKPPQPSSKPPLLTASQKKANHIQSEQKRRANIRRGYEALCECVPALREAIREEEEVLAATHENSTNKSSNSAGKRKAKSLKGRDGEEKIDGRAGPRSENVVLSKTIDYINELIDDRRALLARLHRARSSLPPGHPVLIPLRHQRSSGDETGEGFDQDSTPLWEREWKGGHGSLGNTCGDDDDSS